MRLTLSKIFPAHNGFYFDITHLHKIHKTLLNIKQINSNKISIVDKTSLLLKK